MPAHFSLANPSPPFTASLPAAPDEGAGDSNGDDDGETAALDGDGGRGVTGVGGGAAGSSRSKCADWCFVACFLVDDACLKRWSRYFHSSKFLGVNPGRRSRKSQTVHV